MLVSTTTGQSLRHLRRVAAEEIARSLREHPDQWQWTSPRFTGVRHSSGVRVWTSDLSFSLEQPLDFNGWSWPQYFRLRRAFRSWRRARGSASAASTQEEGLRATIARLTASGSVI